MCGLSLSADLPFTVKMEWRLGAVCAQNSELFYKHCNRIIPVSELEQVAIAEVHASLSNK